MPNDRCQESANVERLSVIQWPRIFAEGTAIVLSILLAFAVDAWWQERREQANYRAQVETLLSEFKESKIQLERQLDEGLIDSLRATTRLLEMIGPEAEVDSPLEAQIAIGQSLATGVFSPELGSLQSVLMARSEIDFIDDDTWTLLQRWPVVINDLEVDSHHLERNREETLIDAVLPLGISMLAVIRPPGDDLEIGELILPESKFDAQLSVLLSDPGIETVFTMRAVRIQLMMQLNRDAIAMADRIIDGLETAILHE